jgi:hypothetical protein
LSGSFYYTYNFVTIKFLCAEDPLQLGVITLEPVDPEDAESSEDGDWEEDQPSSGSGSEAVAIQMPASFRNTDPLLSANPFFQVTQAVISIEDRHRFDADPGPDIRLSIFFMPIMIRIRILPPSFTHGGKSESVSFILSFLPAS